MICTIYAAGELKKRHIRPRDGLLVLPEKDGKLLLYREEGQTLWQLPEGKKEKGESEEEAVRRILGSAAGLSEFAVRPLCEYSVTDETSRRESGGAVWLAEITELFEEGTDSVLFDRLPSGDEMKNAALAGGLKRFAGEAFDERLKEKL